MTSAALSAKQNMGRLARLAVVAIPLIVILIQTLVNLQGFRRADLIALAFGTLAPLLGSAACLIRASREKPEDREGWFGLATAALLWGSAMVLQIAMAITDALNGDAMLILLLFVLYGVPLTFVLASPRGDPWPVRLIDGLGAIALGIFYYILLSKVVSSPVPLNEQGILTVAFMFDVQNATIATFAAIRFAASTDARARTFFGVLSLFAIAYAIQAAAWNHLLLQSEFGSLTDFIFALGFLILVPLALLVNLPGAPGPERERLAQIVHVGSPLMLPASLIILAIILAGYGATAAIAACVAALLIYGARTILIQLYGLKERRQLSELSHIDALTGLPNRRLFDDVLKRELTRAQRDREPLALLMIDVDHFKLLNDRLGHQMGDQLLSAVAAALRRHSARRTDLVARYGGEEFVAILSATAAAALSHAETMRMSVEQLDLFSPAPLGRVTVSIGVTWLAPGETIDAPSLIRQADQALYAAKHAGRNRVAASPRE